MHTCIYFKSKSETNFSFVIFSKTFRVPLIKKNRGCVYIYKNICLVKCLYEYIKIFNIRSVA